MSRQTAQSLEQLLVVHARCQDAAKWEIFGTSTTKYSVIFCNKLTRYLQPNIYCRLKCCNGRFNLVNYIVDIQFYPSGDCDKPLILLVEFMEKHKIRCCVDISLDPNDYYNSSNFNYMTGLTNYIQPATIKKLTLAPSTIVEIKFIGIIYLIHADSKEFNYEQQVNLKANLNYGSMLRNKIYIKILTSLSDRGLFELQKFWLLYGYIPVCYRKNLIELADKQRANYNKEIKTILAELNTSKQYLVSDVQSIVLEYC